MKTKTACLPWVDILYGLNQVYEEIKADLKEQDQNSDNQTQKLKKTKISLIYKKFDAQFFDNQNQNQNQKQDASKNLLESEKEIKIQYQNADKFLQLCQNCNISVDYLLEQTKINYEEQKNKEENQQNIQNQGENTKKNKNVNSSDLGHSGSQFFYFQGQKIIIKTIQKQHFQAFNKKLQKYYFEYFQDPQNIESGLLNKIYGLFQFKHQKKEYFLMLIENIFQYLQKDDKILRIYDLKGSTVGRKQEKFQEMLEIQKKTEQIDKKQVVKGKDVDFRLNPEDNIFQEMNQQQQQQLIEILKKETKILNNCNLMDYSIMLTIGISGENKIQNCKDNIQREENQETNTNLNFQNLNFKRVQLNKNPEYFYSLVLIDYLQEFGGSKKMEYAFKNFSLKFKKFANRKSSSSSSSSSYLSCQEEGEQEQEKISQNSQFSSKNSICLGSENNSPEKEGLQNQKSLEKLKIKQVKSEASFQTEELTTFYKKSVSQKLENSENNQRLSDWSLSVIESNEYAQRLVEYIQYEQQGGDQQIKINKDQSQNLDQNRENNSLNQNSGQNLNLNMESNQFPKINNIPQEFLV
ncbi:hypothetical protein PPERSA_06075 [Pseudocohnilembus persalinus]|uniref:PIPK domain-containing protein n=1 Tax=Pseudocohnilembus persalinus TaxID=266149 RepID=A0A0V0QVI3_PSEPJ|nr:hypothetical protein PPERSA_06075 [Pseudocohnilembus persalinus]|eukprot:KRX06193.1 hypothetical protein PPERSA_06075 [Pseudocohnilembus persalinus]